MVETELGDLREVFFHSKRRLHLQTFKELRAIFRPPRKRTEVLAVRHPSTHFLPGELARLTFDPRALYGFSWQTLQVSGGSGSAMTKASTTGVTACISPQGTEPGGCLGLSSCRSGLRCEGCFGGEELVGTDAAPEVSWAPPHGGQVPSLSLKPGDKRFKTFQYITM